MPEPRGRVAGRRDERRVVFYGLSTCVWCRRTRKLLEEGGVAFDYFYLDLLRGAEREEALAQLRRMNPRVSYPTVVIDDDQCVVGYFPDKLKEALDL